MKKSILLFIMCAATFAFAAGKKTNIVLLMSDDVSWECFPSYGGQSYKTPNLDRICAEGVKFEHCYSQPLCTPSRVKIMTGKYNFRNYISFGELKRDQKTFANMLRDAGYKTCIAGKWQLGYDENVNLMDKFGFDEFCLWQYNIRGRRYWDPIVNENGKMLDTKGKFGPDIFSDFVCKFIEKNKSEPFFVYYPMVLVHGPFVATPDSSKELKEKYFKMHNEKLKRGQRQKEDDSADASFRKGDPELQEAFGDMMMYMDKMIGKVYKKLEDLNLLENTVFIYTSDNGTGKEITSLWNNQKINGGKGTMRDMGNHVPFIYAHKGNVKKGFATKDIIDFSDVYATFAEIAGVKIPAEDKVDGKSFLASTKGDNPNARDWIICHYTPFKGKGSDRMVRNQRYKLYEDGRFYDVSKDMFEENDISKNTENKDYQMLRKVIKSLPPLEKRPIREIEKAKEEPKTYPDWKIAD